MGAEDLWLQVLLYSRLLHWLQLRLCHPPRWSGSSESKGSLVLAAIALMASRHVESDGLWQILLALSLFLTMMTAVFVAINLRRTIPDGSLKEPLKEPLAHGHTDDMPDAEQGLAPSQQQLA